MVNKLLFFVDVYIFPSWTISLTIKIYWINLRSKCKMKVLYNTHKNRGPDT